MFGNNFRNKAAIKFLGFEQGSRKSGNIHFHILLAITGEHDWSDERITQTLYSIDRARKKEKWEKPIHIDYDWEHGNSFHRYCSREAAINPDSVIIFRN